MLSSSQLCFGSSADANNVAAATVTGGLPGTLAQIAINKAREKRQQELQKQQIMTAYQPDVFALRQTH